MYERIIILTKKLIAICKASVSMFVGEGIITGHKVIAGSTAEEIIDFADKYAFDLAAMSTRVIY